DEATAGTFDLVRNLGRLAPYLEWVVLTCNRSHGELAHLDTPNMRRVCALNLDPPPPPRPTLRQRAMRVLRKYAGLLLPGRVKKSLKKMLGEPERPPKPQSLLQALNVDLLYCPFTVSTFFDATVPFVSTVQDVRSRCYTDYFGPRECP